MREQLREFLSAMPILHVGLEESDGDPEILRMLIDDASLPRPGAHQVIAPWEKPPDFGIGDTEQAKNLQVTLPKVKIVHPKSIAFTAPSETLPDIHAINHGTVYLSQNLQYAPQQQIWPIENTKTPISIFIAYARKDKRRLEQLELWLTMLKDQKGLNIFWVSCEMTESWKLDIKDPLNVLDLILLLFSPEFLASGYCNTHEMECAVNRHHQGTAWVSPVLLRPCIWNENLFGRLPFLPADDISVARWPRGADDAFSTIAEGITRAVKYLEARR